MARYINADKTIESLTKLINDTFSVYADIVAYQVREAVNSMPTADIREVMASAWIPVSERLPEPRTNCLITTTYGDVELVCFTGVVWWLGADQSDYWTEQVLAWMPLPESFTP